MARRAGQSSTFLAEIIAPAASPATGTWPARMQGQHGFHTATAEDHRAWLWVRLKPPPSSNRAVDMSQVASILSLLYSVLCLAARLVGKWDMLWWDDAVLGIAYVRSAGGH